MSKTSSKVKIFELAKNKNSNSNIFHRLASVNFGFWLSKIFGIQWKKVTFSKKGKKIHITKFRPDRKTAFTRK
jgi:hypothetical protein